MVPTSGTGDGEAAGLVHPTAEIESGVVLGAGTRIWARTHIRRGASIGPGGNVGEGVLIDVGVVIGARCKIQSHALLFEGARVGDEVFIGPAACLTNDRYPRASTPDGRLKDHSDWTLAGVDIARGASLGAAAVVIGGVRVGPSAMVAAGAIVARDVPAHALVAGNPARRVRWVCACGRPLDPEFVCPACAREHRAEGTGLVAVG